MKKVNEFSQSFHVYTNWSKCFVNLLTHKAETGPSFFWKPGEFEREIEFLKSEGKRLSDFEKRSGEPGKKYRAVKALLDTPEHQQGRQLIPMEFAFLFLIGLKRINGPIFEKCPKELFRHFFSNNKGFETMIGLKKSKKNKKELNLIDFLINTCPDSTKIVYEDRNKWRDSLKRSCLNSIFVKKRKGSFYQKYNELYRREKKVIKTYGLENPSDLINEINILVMIREGYLDQKGKVKRKKPKLK